MNADNIPTAELFADLQVSLTEIVLIELLDDAGNYSSRLNANCNIRDIIKGILKERFSESDIIGFLEHGYPCLVDVSRTVQ